jgi:hypothetical protein
VHFEAVHELSQPSYQSKYPPLQGLMLAAGQKLAGDPWLGVLLSAGLMCGALCWMLQGWVAPGWALTGALLALLQFGIFRYWTNSYWGGAMAAFGGALVLGAAARLLWPERSRLSASANGALLACGIAVLANSRPFEGLLFCAAVGIAMVSVYGRATGRLFSIRAMAPAALVLASTAGAMAYYNFRVTGDALTLPYQAHEKQYAVAAAFLFQPARPVPEYHHKELKDFWAGWDVEVLRIHEAKPALYWTVQMASLVPFFLGIGPELLAILVALWAWRVREIRLALIATVLFFLPLFFAKAFPAHYVAPMTAVFLLAVTLALQRLGTKTRFLLACILLATAVEFALAIIHPPSDFILEQREFAAKRSAILSELRSLPGDHLVIVQYAPGHNVREGWIYNAADIDGSRVVWAHDMGALKNKELTGYYPARTVWLCSRTAALPA